MKHIQNESSLNNTGDQDNNQSDSRELVEHKNIPDTPFEAVRVDEKWFLTLGKYRLTEPFKTYEEVEHDAYSTTWYRIMQIIQIMIDENEQKKSVKYKQVEQQLNGIDKQ